MSELFKRNLYVELVDKNGKGEKFIARSIDFPNGFDITFNVEKNSEKEPNESTIGIYNLNEETRRKLDEEYVGVFLYGGYGDIKNLKLVSLGAIIKVKSKYNDASIESEIVFADDSRNYRESTIYKTFPSNTSYKKIIQEIAKSMGYTSPKILDLDENLKITNSQTLAGNSAKYLKEYCYKMGVRYSTQNGQIIIRKDDIGINNDAIVIDEDHGLVGTIEKTITKIHKKYNKTRKPLKKPTAKSLARRAQNIAEATAKFESKQFDKEHTVEFKTLLMPEIIPGSYFVLNAKFFPKTYAICKEVTQSGGNTDNEFYSNVKAIIL